MKLRIAEKDYKELRRVTSTSFLRNVEFAHETGCILLMAANAHPANPSLLVTEVMLPGQGELAETASDGLVFSAGYLRRALLKCRGERLAGFLTVHTHPLAGSRVGFSTYDDEQDPVLMKNLYELQPDGVFGSLVLGRESIAGRAWSGDTLSAEPLDELVIVGESVKSVSLRGEPPAPLAADSGIFDRALAITGAGALSNLSKMRVGVVGLGGTGSLMVELLLRAGVGEIVGFDFDVAEDSNLNRVLHLRQIDARSGRLKIERLMEVVGETGLPSRLTAAPGGDVRNAETASQLAGCDLIVGCVDRDWPRLIMCEASYQYLIPLIDIGTEIGFSGSQVLSVDSRVSVIGPGRPCLICSGVISMERIRIEGYGSAERRRVLNMGYSADIELRAPAVMDLNMRAASMAMLVVRHLLQTYMLNPLPHTIKEALTNFAMRTLRHNPGAACPICGSARLGVGDGMRLTTRRAMRGGEDEPSL